MAMRKLADPILNDLLLMLQGRRLTDLTPTAQSRYIKHLDRIDGELEAARFNGGSIPLAFNDEAVLITKAEIEQVRGAVVRLQEALAAAHQELIPVTAKATALDQFSDVLFAEFGEHIPDGATDALDAALRLLRLDAASAAVVQTSAGKAPSPTGHRRSR